MKKSLKSWKSILLAGAMALSAVASIPTKGVEASTLPIGQGGTFVFNKVMVIKDDSNNSGKDSYYTMNIKKSGYFEIHCVTNSLDALEIRDEDNNAVYDARWYGGGEGNRKYLRAGKYSVRARGWDDCECVFYWYDANETFADGFTKNNDSEDTPTVITADKLTGAKWTGMFSTNDDYDWYKFTMKNKGKLTFSLSEKTPDIGLKYMLTTANGRVLADSASNQLENGKTTFTLAKGTYKLRISKENSGIYNFKMKATYPSIYTWKKTAKGKMYVDQYGKYIKNTWKKINGKWYYFKKNGIMKTGWLTLNGKKYYLAASGARVTGLKVIKGKKYCFGASGAMLKGFRKISGSKYYFDKKTGAALKGWQKISGKWYYFDPSTKEMYTGGHYIKGKYYFFSYSTGVLQ